MKSNLSRAAVLFALLGSPAQALAWGHTAHVGINTLAIGALPTDLPAFVRSAASMQFLAELGGETEQLRVVGNLTSPSPSLNVASTALDADLSPARFVDVGDDGLIGGVVALASLPRTREQYDSILRTTYGNLGQNTQYRVGYLPYEIIEGFQRLRKDFAIWRTLKVGLATATASDDISYFKYQIKVRQRLILRDIGYWSGAVAHASQPLRVSIHFNGWGSYPNPYGFTQAPINTAFESSFVRKYIDFKTLSLRPYSNRGVSTIEQRVPLYLSETLGRLIPLYQAEMISGGDQYQNNIPPEFAVVRASLEAGAAELRDLIVDAWSQSTTLAVGSPFPVIRVDDALAGRVRVTPEIFGSD